MSDPNTLNRGLDPFEYLPNLTLPRFEDLTPDQQTAIQQGPGWIETPAADNLYEPLDPNQFVTDILGINDEDLEQRRLEAGVERFIDVTNFASYFERPKEDSFLAMRAAGMPALRRLEIIFPGVVSAIEERVAGHDKWTLDRKTLDALFYVHRLMRQLVDLRDPYVTPHNDGKVDIWYLLR